MVCKTKSSKQNAYSMKSNFMGSLYKSNAFLIRIFVKEGKCSLKNLTKDSVRGLLVALLVTE